MKALHFGLKGGEIAPEFFAAVREIPGLELTLVDEGPALSPAKLAREIRGFDILLASRKPHVPDELAEDPGRLKYICYLHGTMRKVIGLPIIRSKIRVTNWGDAAGQGLAEASLTLLLASFKNLHARIAAVRSGADRPVKSAGTSISRLQIGIYGFGFAGREFARLLQPFGAVIRVYDPYAGELPEYCQRAGSLKELFAASQAIVIHAGLTPETENAVTKELLALLPDQGIVINTARGAIVEQPALFAELKSGRLRAGLDVLWPDELPPDHEARRWENLIWTCHRFGGEPWPEEPADGLGSAQYRVALENIKAFVAGRPLRFVIDETRYSRMT